MGSTAPVKRTCVLLAAAVLGTAAAAEASGEDSTSADHSPDHIGLRHGLELGGHSYVELGTSSVLLGGGDLGYRPLDFLYVGASFSDGGCVSSSCRALRYDVCPGCTFSGVTEGSAVIDGVLPLSFFVSGLQHLVAPLFWLELGIGLRNMSMFDPRIARDASELNGIFSTQLGFSLSVAERFLFGVYGGFTITDVSSEIYGAEVFPTSNGGAAFGTVGTRVSYIFRTVD